MYTILRSDEFDDWLKGLKDDRAVACIRSIEAGNFGDMARRLGKD